MAESNRERAARGGWGLGAVAGVGMSANRRILSGDGTLRVYADDGVTVLRENRLPATTWNGVPVPFEQVDTARHPQANPKPAPGQVWAPPAGGINNYEFHPTPLLLDADGTLTVGCVDPLTPASVVWDRSGGDGETRETTLEDITAANGWRCIGVATEHGRVMVGDVFCAAGDPVPSTLTVSAVLDGSRVRMSDGYETTAHSVVLWDRTRYAPARVGERYLHRSRKFLVVIPATPSTLRLGNAMGLDEVRVHLSAGVSMPVDEWERLDPSTASHAAGPVPPHGGPAEAIALANGIRDALRRMRDEDSTRLANPGGIPTASPEPTAEERAAMAIADRRALDLGVPRREGEPLAAFARRCNAVEVRRAVDQCVTADHGPFATARAAALHAWAETVYSHDTVADIAAVHAGLLRYEALRGSRREPSLAALDVGVPETARAMYERERAAVRVEAVTPREEPARPTGVASLNGWQTAAHFWERWSR